MKGMHSTMHYQNISNSKLQIFLIFPPSRKTMGIHGLMKLLNEECPGSIKEQEVLNVENAQLLIFN